MAVHGNWCSSPSSLHSLVVALTQWLIESAFKCSSTCTPIQLPQDSQITFQITIELHCLCDHGFSSPRTDVRKMCAGGGELCSPCACPLRAAGGQPPLFCDARLGIYHGIWHSAIRCNDYCSFLLYFALETAHWTLLVHIPMHPLLCGALQGRAISSCRCVACSF